MNYDIFFSLSRFVRGCFYGIVLTVKMKSLKNIKKMIDTANNDNKKNLYFDMYDNSQ